MTITQQSFPQSGTPVVDLTTGVITRAWHLFFAVIFARVGGAGIVMPSYTTPQKNALTNVAAGTTVFDSTLRKLSFYTGTTWENVTSAPVL